MASLADFIGIDFEMNGLIFPIAINFPISMMFFTFCCGS